jgi:hypothetical protein
MPDGSQTTATVTEQTATTQTAETGTESQTATTQTTEQTTQTTEAVKRNAPEAYEFKAPEGQSFNEQVLAAYTTAAKELDLTQDAAQKILDSVAPVMAAQQAEAVTALKAGWAEASKNDAEFGGEKFDENLAVAKKGLESFATPEFVEFLNTSGLGDHPEVLRTFLRIGKAIGEDNKIVTGGPTKDAPKTLAQRMYPDMNP